MATINYLTTIEFDHGAVARAAEIAGNAGIRKPLLVTDPGIAAGPLLARVREVLAPLGPAIFDATPQNPTEEAVEAAVAAYRSNG